MNIIWTFGDSFTYGNGCLDNEAYPNSYKKSDKDIIWPQLISSELNLKLKNLAGGLFSNDKIIDSIIENYEHINKNDLVIIGNSFYNRFDIPYNGELITLSPTNLPKNNNKLLNDIIVFMDDELLKIRQLNRIKFIKNILEKKGVNCIVWEVDTQWMNYENIQYASSNQIIDLHWSYKGHYDFSNHILNIINKTI
jgi:hypothetical protein